MKKIALLFVVMLTAVSLYASDAEIGRYQTFSSGNSQVGVIDTATGKVWLLRGSEGWVAYNVNDYKNFIPPETFEKNRKQKE